jgi:tetratricopeptide (TPR) repeat protein
MTADTTISRFRRDLAFSRVLKALFLCAVLGGLLLPSLVLPAVACAWIVLSVSSAKGSRLTADSPSLIAAGRFDEAEQRIEEALRSFSLFRTGKLVSLHHLAVLRHAQRRWQDAAALSRALLSQPLGPLQGIAKPARLILADALLELGDTDAAGEAIARLFQTRLSLNEMLTLLAVQLDYQSRVGAWREMTAALGTKVQLAELMPAHTSARAQALLALAAKQTDEPTLANWLRRRAELLTDMQKLATERPFLWALWEKEGGK